MMVENDPLDKATTCFPYTTHPWKHLGRMAMGHDGHDGSKVDSDGAWRGWESGDEIPDCLGYTPEVWHGSLAHFFRPGKGDSFRTWNPNHFQVPF